MPRGIISEVERDQVLTALDTVADEMANGTFTFVPTDEDIHTAVERRVTELAGPAGAKLHTGRSRNDQSATDVRLWCKRELAVVARRIIELQAVLLHVPMTPARRTCRATRTCSVPNRCCSLTTCSPTAGRSLATSTGSSTRSTRVDVSPLGAGALAGSSLPLDPDGTAADLGFARRFDNSLDAVGSRDHVAEVLFALTMVAIDLSRIGEELVLWTTDEFGFATLDDGYSTGSSMLPQKKNPDIAELARGKAGRLIGDLTGFLATMKGLPLSYNRDYQEDKEPLFDAVDQVRLALGAITGMIATATFVPERMQAAADSETSSATDLAEWLVQRGMPFREAHAVVGQLVRQALSGAQSLHDLVAAHSSLGPDAAALVAPGVSVRRRVTPGGAGPVPVADQLVRFHARLSLLREAF